MQMHLFQFLQLCQALWLTPPSQNRIVAAPIEMHSPHHWRYRVNDLAAQINLAPIPVLHTHPFERLLNGVVAVRWLLKIVYNNPENGLDVPLLLEPPEKEVQIGAARTISPGMSLVRTLWTLRAFNSNLWYRYILENILKLEILDAALNPALADGRAATVQIKIDLAFWAAATINQTCFEIRKKAGAD
jgi:hypothetical protein